MSYGSNLSRAWRPSRVYAVTSPQPALTFQSVLQILQVEKRSRPQSRRSPGGTRHDDLAQDDLAQINAEKFRRDGCRIEPWWTLRQRPGRDHPDRRRSTTTPARSPPAARSLLGRHQDRDRHDQREGRRRGQYKICRSTPTRSPRPTSPSTRPSACSSQEKVEIVDRRLLERPCVPLAAKVDAAKKIHVGQRLRRHPRCSRTRTCKYVFRPQVHSDQFGEASCQLHRRERQGEARQGAQGRQGRHHPRGRPLRRRRRRRPTRRVARSSACRSCSRKATRPPRPTSPRWSPSCGARGADVILHTGYNPDITLFLRQATRAGLRFKMLIGHGAGYGQIDKLRETFGKDVDYFYNVDPVAGAAARSEDARSRASATSTRRWSSATRPRPTPTEVPPHVSMGFNQTWIFLNDVLPRAIKKHGGFDARGAAQGRARDRHPGGRHHPGLRREVLPARAPDGRAERALVAGRDAVRRRRAPRSSGRARSRPSDPVLPLPDGPSPYAAALKESARCVEGRPGLTKRFGGFTAGRRGVLRGRARARSSGLIGPNGSGKSTIFNCIAGHATRRRPAPSASRRGDRRPAAERDLPPGHRPHLPDPAPVPQALAARERRARRLLRRRPADIAAPKRWHRAEEALRLVGLPTDARSDDRRARRGRAEEARAGARARHPAASCCWPTRASAASTPPRWSRPPTCCERIRSEGHHHRLGRAHHGRADARGRPRGGARPRREDLRGRAAKAAQSTRG